MSEEILLEEEKEFKRVYKLSLWWIEHRALLKKVGYGVFIVFDVLVLLFVFWVFLDTYAVSYDSEQSAIVRMVALGQEDLHAYTLANAAKPLRESIVRILPTGRNSYDFYTILTNPNDDWWAEFTYSFSSSLGKTSVERGFILPGEEKPVSIFSIESTTPITQATLEIVDIQWKRVDRHAIPDYQNWAEDRLSLEISDIVFEKDFQIDTESIGRTSFTVQNNSAYSYYEPRFYILLKRGAHVVGLNRTVLGSLDSGESQEVIMNWFGTIPSVNKVEVIPEVNIFDLNVYKPLIGESTIDTRTRVFSRR